MNFMLFFCLGPHFVTQVAGIYLSLQEKKLNLQFFKTNYFIQYSIGVFL